VLGFDGFQLDGDFFTRDDVDSEVDITWKKMSKEGSKRRLNELTEGAGTNLLAESVLATHPEVESVC
jgi:hypothetical protein